MDDNIKKNHDDEINVAEIMQEIREKIRKQKSEFHSTESVSDTIFAPIQAHDISPVQINLNGSNLLNSIWDIRDNTYEITSHRKYLGKFLVKGRQIVNGEVRRYVDSIIWKQSSFNERVAHLSSLYENRILELEESLALQKIENLQKYHDLEKSLALQKIENLQKYHDLEESIVKQKNEILQKYEDFQQLYLKLEEQENQIISDLANIHLEQSNNSERIAELNSTIENNNVKLLSNISESITDVISSLISNNNPETDKQLNYYRILKQDDMDYFAFEERFRGSRTEIKNRQFKYFQFFEHCTNVLDIGCGRGEFLELLKDHEIPGVGIDINKDMVNYCNSKGFTAVRGDAIIYLCSLDDNYLDGIFSDQVIEHLTPDYLIRLVNLAYKKLKTDTHIVLGTMNILNPRGLANFFVDPTHVSPIHPEYIKYCLETTGFRNIQILFRTYDERENESSKVNLELVAADYVIIGTK
jgi:SAM-dependent methyltransferase